MSRGKQLVQVTARAGGRAGCLGPWWAPQAPLCQPLSALLSPFCREHSPRRLPAAPTPPHLASGRVQRALPTCPTHTPGSPTHMALGESLRTVRRSAGPSLCCAAGGQQCGEASPRPDGLSWPSLPRERPGSVHTNGSPAGANKYACRIKYECKMQLSSLLYKQEMFP